MVCGHISSDFPILSHSFLPIQDDEPSFNDDSVVKSLSNFGLEQEVPDNAFLVICFEGRGRGMFVVVIIERSQDKCRISIVF